MNIENQKSSLRLSLKTKWFEMTKSGIKPEDYREINRYWCRRLLEFDDETEVIDWGRLIEDLSNPEKIHEDIYECLSFYGARFKKFDVNIMTLGYPKSTDTERILNLEHKGIEIRTGNPEWGAELNKKYFVIIHGAVENKRVFCRRIKAGMYYVKIGKYEYEIYNYGYYAPDKCIWWEAVNLATNEADFHKHTKWELIKQMQYELL